MRSRFSARSMILVVAAVLVGLVAVPGTAQAAAFRLSPSGFTSTGDVISGWTWLRATGHKAVWTFRHHACPAHPAVTSTWPRSSPTAPAAGRATRPRPRSRHQRDQVPEPDHPPGQPVPSGGPLQLQRRGLRGVRQQVAADVHRPRCRAHPHHDDVVPVPLESPRRGAEVLSGPGVQEVVATPGDDTTGDWACGRSHPSSSPGRRHPASSTGPQDAQEDFDRSRIHASSASTGIGLATW